MASIRTTRNQGLWNNDTWIFLSVKMWQQTSVNSYEALYDSTWFALSRVSHNPTSSMTNRQQGKPFVSIRQHFQPTQHSPPEVKIREIMIHESSLFLKRGHKLQSIHTICVDSTTFSTHPQSPDQLYFLAPIDSRHVESTERETIPVDSME